MDQNSKLLNYSNEIPPEIRLLLKGLSADDRLGILVALMKNGKMTFNQMKNEFDLNSSSLSNHLTVLQNGNLIENFYEKGDEKAFSYYDVTDIPEAIFDSLFDIMFKPTVQEEHYDEVSQNKLTRKTVGAGSLPTSDKEETNWSRAVRSSTKINRRIQRITSNDYRAEYDEIKAT